jgi:lipopolysaccharide transport system permease protein
MMPASSETGTLSPTATSADVPRAAGDGASLRPSPHASWGGLIWTLIRTDFKARYHGTFSGFVWALLKPTAMFVVLVGVFSLIFRSEPNYKLKLIVGLFLWDFFADATKTGMTSLSAKGFLVSKARFPRWILVVTSLANALITLGVFAAVITTYLIAVGRPPAPVNVVAFSFYMSALVVMVTGVSLGSSVLFLRFRDLNQIWDMTIQAGFFLAPIVYPLGVIPERYHAYLYLWPPTPVIEFARAALITGVLPTTRAHAYLAVMAAGILTAGSIVYRRFAPRVAEYV